MNLEIHLCGDFRLCLEGKPLATLDKPRQQALLAYLLLHRRAPQSRQQIAFQFWPDSTEAQAQGNLRKLLFDLRKSLPVAAEFLFADSQSLGWRLDAPFVLDVAQVEEALAQLQRAGKADRAIVERLIALYTGELLPTCYDEWLLPLRRMLHEGVVKALEKALADLETAGDGEMELRAAEHLLQIDPCSETAYLHLMRQRALAGDRSGALRLYHECVAMLERELGVPPNEATRVLYEEIQRDFKAARVVNGNRPAKSPETLTKPRQTTLSLPAFLADGATQAEMASVFVGRTRALAELAAGQEEARAGRGQLRFVTGGAGQGKTALVQEFVRQAQGADRELLVISGSCSANTGAGDPYLPFREALAMLAGEVEAQWAGGLLSADHARRLWEAQPMIVPLLVERAPDLIGSFVPAQALYTRAVAVTAPGTSWLMRLASPIMTNYGLPLDETRLLTQYTLLLKAVAAQRPLLLILEDLHWIDTASSGLLFHLSRALSDSRILLVGTYRPDEVASSQRAGDRWVHHPLGEMAAELKRRHGDIWLDLDDLATVEGRHFVDAYLDTQPNLLGESFRSAFFRHTEGHALFTVELLHDMQARGDLRQNGGGDWVEGEVIDWKTLPARVEGVIERHINRLDAAEQALLRVASVEGEIFTAEVVARVQGSDARALVERLSRELDRQHGLVNAQTLEWQGQQRLSRYRFRHYLFQQYLYRSLDEMERAYLHEAIGLALEALYGEQAEVVAVQLAHHFVQAGLTEKAVGALFLAGQQAQRLAAYQEAIQHISRALTLLRMLPDTPQRDRQELDIQLALGLALALGSDVSMVEQEAIYRRAVELSRQLGETFSLCMALWGLSAIYIGREEYQLAREYGEEVLLLSQGWTDTQPQVEALRNLGITLHQLGEFSASNARLEQLLALTHRQQPGNLLSPYSDAFARVMALAFLAVNRWVFGYPDQALRTSQKSLSVAEEKAYPFVLAMALHLSAWLHELRREGERVHTQGLAALRVATDYHLTQWLSHAIIDEGWAWIDQGRVEAGIARIQQGVDELRDIGQPQSTAYFSTLLAKGYAALGQSQAGLEVVAEALASVERSGQRWCEAELHRLHGELLRLQGSQEDEAEICFWQAIDVARRQQAKSWELRATMSLCRLWQAQGKDVQAHELLAQIYNWFSEGFDTPDLIDAKALLVALV